MKRTHLVAGLGRTKYWSIHLSTRQRAHPPSVNDADSMVDNSRRSKSLEANRAQHTIDESHLQSSSLDDAFDPFDFFDVGGAVGESSAQIDLGLELGLDWDAAPE
jgi:hypothetical protein